MKGLLSRKARWILLILAIPALLAIAWYGYLFVSSYFSPEQIALRDYFNELEKLAIQEQTDTYYGETPEETLALFTAALEEGDIELASKYFEVYDREKALGELKEMKDEETLSLAVQNLKKLQMDTIRDNYAYFVTTDENNVVEIEVVIKKISDKGWKMYEL